MAKAATGLHNEADVRAKVVDVWLREHGFTANDISVERGFVLRFGRGVYKVSGGISSHKVTRATARADYVVRNSAGKNLFVVETKAPGEAITADARQQGLAYARLLEGGPAPFTILTNGVETEVLETASARKLQTPWVPLDDAPRLSGLTVSGDALNARAEALEYLISLTTNNLLAFCQQQVTFHIACLRSDDLHSGRKYIPRLHVERSTVLCAVNGFLEKVVTRCVVLVGDPQVGKTSFLCNFVEKRIALGHPTLFYPAITMQNGLADELREDFESVFHDYASGLQEIVAKLSRVLRRSKQKLLIVIDGWNEANIHLSRLIDTECGRVASDSVQVLISLTTQAAERLLLDPVGNPSKIAVELGLSRNEIRLIPLDSAPVAKVRSLVKLTAYSSEEMGEAYKTYAEAYNVAVPSNHVCTKDPLLLRTAMEIYSGGSLPPTLDEPMLVAQRIHDRLERVQGLDVDSGNLLLSAVADVLMLSGAPCDERRVALGVPIANTYLEAALVTRSRHVSGPSLVDFYYSRERDYTVAFRARNWPVRLGTNGAVEEFNLAVAHAVGRDALSWFFCTQAGRPALINAVSSYTLLSGAAKIILLNAVGRSASSPNCLEPLQVLNTTNALEDGDPKVRITAAKLLVFHQDDDPLAEFIAQHYDVELLTSLLTVGEEFPLEHRAAGEIVLRAIGIFIAREGEEDRVSKDLHSLCESLDPVKQKHAALAFASLEPRIYFSALTSLLQTETTGWKINRVLQAASIKEAVKSLSFEYWGDVCPGRFGYSDKEEILEEYKELLELVTPLLKCLPSEEASREIRELLKDVFSRCEIEDERIDLRTPRPSRQEMEEHFGQTSLDFPGRKA